MLNQFCPAVPFYRLRWLKASDRVVFLTRSQPNGKWSPDAVSFSTPDFVELPGLG